MDIQKVYVKTRSEFGKQCIFDTKPATLDVDIMPNPADMGQYIRRTHCHVGVQHSKRFALHEVRSTFIKAQISRPPTKNSGMLHFEGGWPREINPRDEEATTRFRRRVEKDEHWAPRLRHLFEVMQCSILQNGTVNIYQHYFDDMIPTELVQPVGLRTVNMYRDPETPKRPVTNISWSPDSCRRIMVSYCFLQFERMRDYSNTVYIWDVDNSNKPYMGLEPFLPCVSSEFNPRDPSVLASGLINGQVCSWDIRASTQPILASHPQHGHRECANAIKWLPTKSNTEFFSTSLDGRAMWWDLRHLRVPTDVLLFDLEQPNEPHMNRAIGVSCLNFGPMVGMKFMFGLENGIILTGSRKAKTNAEKLSTRLEAHYGRVNSVDRNFGNPAIFLSVGDWRARVWVEDTREGCLVSTPFLRDHPTGGCWNKARHSAFYVTTASGRLLVWDILQSLRNPVSTLQLCHNALTCLAPCEEDVFLTIGNIAGEVFLVEPTEFFQSFDKTERSLLSEYMERCSRVTKAVDARLREIKLVQRIIKEEEETVTGRGTRRGSRTEKARGQRKDKEIRQSRSKEKRRIRDEAPEIMEAEARYFEAVQNGLEVYASESDPDVIPVPPHPAATKKHDRRRTPMSRRDSKSEMDSKSDQEPTKKPVHRQATKVKMQLLEEQRKTFLPEKSIAPQLPRPAEERVVSPAPSIEPVAKSQMETGRKERSPRIAFKLPVPCEDEICEPKVCCTRPGWKGRRKQKKPRPDEITITSVPDNVTEKSSATSRTLRRQRSRVLRQMRAPPTGMSEEVARARAEIRMTNRIASSGKHQRMIGPSPETKKKPVGRRKALHRPASDSTQLEEPGQDSTRKEERAVKRGEQRRRRVDPCSPAIGKSTQEQVTAILNIPPLELAADNEIQGQIYLDEYEHTRKRVYPRISEFHLVN